MPKHGLLLACDMIFRIFCSILGMLLLAILLTLGFYRKWKIEQEIEGLLWKINIDSLLVSNKQRPPERGCLAPSH